MAQEEVNSSTFRTAPTSWAAHNFNMPALSPTMTEGNIATWRVKEGDSFSAGDVLLEIETDKAQMDVEAQDDGVLAKIIQGDGSKSVQVGTRIAITAEPGDDLSSLELPPEDSAAPKESPAAKEAPKQSSPIPKEERTAAEAPRPPAQPTKNGGGGKAQKQTYPLYPSVEHLLKENGLSKDDADKIPATGPNGRLLKGDVLAFLGRIEQSYAAEQSERIKKLAHLDLSNIKMAAPKPAPAKEAKVVEETPAIVEEPPVAITLPVSFKAVIECQKRVQESLGVFLPISTFIARATELANEDLPKSKTAKPTADELFNAVLGLDKVAGRKYTRGHFAPQLTGLIPTPSAPTRPSPARKSDILDILSGKKPTATSRKAPAITERVSVEPVNVFTVTVPKGDERQGHVFLQRLKTILEVEPGRLVV
ncbi:uncharacterized protein EI97DRAFT_494486 [Westerdykella ornata]|uniref:Pyruvate dehydrogenase protein x component n=1 Tax=Westerdykella ornata TaxID=318751 RepID=A0A6A6JM45_WESOR|nr:uncharacterized protein EI97DRAFT_494486 [Westerdykella ornata]KAF2275989.1 hypothetical protein EI97DRAFT_494486 [Westerdykella ornata]